MTLSAVSMTTAGSSPGKRGGDRRRRQRLISRYTLFGGRRRAARRGGEGRGYVADMHGSVLFTIVAAVVLLNVLDAYFTMLFLSYGGIEANPLVDWVLKSGGVWPFIIFKSIGIGLCLGFLTLTKNFWVSRAGMGVVVAGYSVLLCWHLYLYARLPA